jgi:hypothetical protein
MTPDTPLTDAVARLQQAPLGKALYARQQGEDGRWETVWLVRDEARQLASPGPEPAVEFRAGAFDQGGVLVLPILLRVGTQEPGCVYDTWINASQIEGENIYLQDLSRQEHIRVYLYVGTAQPVHAVTVPNRLRELAMGVLARQADYQPSTETAFEYACERFLANYTDVQALWHVLGSR